MKTITIVSVLIGVILGIKIYPCLQSKGWIVNPIAKHNYDAYYEREKQYKEEKERDTQFYKQARIAHIRVENSHYPRVLVSTTTTKTEFFSFYEPDTTKQLIATSSEVALDKGCKFELKSEEIPDSFGYQTYRYIRENYGLVYEIKCK